ncbi:MAG: tryptophan--tRNA ligase [Candidatus Onthomorpha sp.]|nr:tryptophan--tRNA ligase [Bacteroidales bacterium]MDY3976743.1 tryptophan--tRNA ligase [Candidatus Onthomorpha sp.]MCI6417103.1 tryptophan--tRNA ligase [Bacteroidales bacterium]MCI6645096.1 tryptophan--tRNA ligase [Bacteroidales bacterium]MCI6800391.1 tryptophan--tRNA ligase [Bacteroidales bacterium]
MKTIVSGMRPTGNLHLGSYFGALKNFVRLQEQAKCYFFVADYHLLTTHPNPANLHQNVKTILAQYIACGLDPDKATIYIQSQVPQVVELYMFLNMNAYLGELERVSSFKDKVRQNPQNVNAGLLTYPTLMAADILLHKADAVPVGKDQEQHLEMTRTFASRFNRMYSVDYFTEPVAYNFGNELVKVPGLDGSGKMSKSVGEAATLYLVDSPEVIRKKIMKAKTDAGPQEKNSPKTPEIENLFSLLKLVSSEDIVRQFEDLYADCTIRYGDLKKQLAQDMETFIAPIRERIKQVEADDDYLSKVARQGCEKAMESASKTIREVREIIGFRPF